MVAAARNATGVLARLNDYAEGVCDGSIVAGRLVRLACERHLRDVSLGSLRGLEFSEDAADHVIRFLQELKHSIGDKAEQKFILEPWQVFIVGSVFGWMRADDTRRFRRVHTEVARKNGKTTLLAGVGLYLAFADSEPGAEVYSAATKRDQAKICWNEARRMVEGSKTLRQHIVITPSQSNLSRRETNSKFEPLGRDADTSDGLNPHAALIDELHAHPNRDLVDVLDTALGARRQPIRWNITTAGSNQESIWWEEREYAVRVLEGVVEDDTLFAYIATLDKDDDWRDEAVWAKGNPNLGVSVRLDALREECAAAQQIKDRQNGFRRLRMNEPTEQSERWIDMAQWDACADAPQVEDGAACFVGIDLSSKVDLTAAVAVFAAEDGYLDVLCRFWRPEEGVIEAEKRDGVPYRRWASEGLLTLLEGGSIDTGQVGEDIIDWTSGWEVREFPFDSWNAAGTASKLERAGAVIVAVAQGFATYTEPCHQLEAWIADGKIRHGGHPILRWMASQMQVKMGPNDAIRPWKPHGSGLRNDGIVAMLMAVNRLLLHQQQDDEPYIVTMDLRP